MASTHQAQNPLHNLSSQAKHAEILPNLHTSLISIGKLCDNEFQLVPPHMHQRNAAERDVRTFKNHFISAVEPLFPFYLWYHLFYQVTMTINILRRSRLNPGLSAYEQVDGIHNFERTPLAPLGCEVKIH